MLCCTAIPQQHYATRIDRLRLATGTSPFLHVRGTARHPNPEAISGQQLPGLVSWDESVLRNLRFFQAMEPEIAWHLHTAGFCLWSLQTILMVSSYQSCGFLHFLTFKYTEGLLLLSLFYTTFKKGLRSSGFLKGSLYFPQYFLSFLLLAVLSAAFILLSPLSSWLLLLILLWEAYTSESTKARKSPKLRVFWLKEWLSQTSLPHINKEWFILLFGHLQTTACREIWADVC